MQQFTSTTNGIHIRGLTTSQFKTSQCQIQFVSPLSNKSAPRRALLAYLLKAVSQDFPTRKQMNHHLESLYASHLRVGVKKVGNAHVITFYLSVINHDFTLEKEDLLEALFKVLSGSLYSPLFDPSIFNEERQALIDYMNEVASDPLKYALLETYNTMYDGDPYHTRSLGTIADLEAVTLEDIHASYQSLIEEDTIYVEYVGNRDEETVTNLVSHYLKPNTVKKAHSFISPSDFSNIQPIDKRLYKPIKQTKLVTSYRVPVTYDHDDYYTLVVLNALLGGGSDSLLFHEVRNNAGLCYFIGSSYDQFKGSVIIYTGIEKSNEEAVLPLINDVIDSIKSTTYQTDHLTIAKKAIITSLISSLDSSYSLLNHLAKGLYFNKPFDPDHAIEAVKRVTQDDIARCAKQLILNVTVIVEGGNDENNNL
ncbi:MAG: pitrilysin family protein [Candidatus Izemoplasma sp.]|nr:pitrilysin family protein [Candidatus Izemoplasma sp.]